MQFLSNLTDKQRQYLIISVTLLIVIPLFYFVYQASNNSDPNKKGTYFDKNSGQTVTNNNALPETYGVDPTTPTYLGITKLFDIGVTKYQLVALEQALFDFAKTVSDKPSELSVDINSISEVSYDSESDNPTSEVSFILQVDRKTKYKIRMHYSGLGTVKITASSLKDEQLYISSEVDGTEISE